MLNIDIERTRATPGVEYRTNLTPVSLLTESRAATSAAPTVEYRAPRSARNAVTLPADVARRASEAMAAGRPDEAREILNAHRAANSTDDERAFFGSTRNAPITTDRVKYPRKVFMIAVDDPAFCERRFDAAYSAGVDKPFHRAGADANIFMILEATMER